MDESETLGSELELEEHAVVGRELLVHHAAFECSDLQTLDEIRMGERDTRTLYIHHRFTPTQ